jgi:hypothetical protein
MPHMSACLRGMLAVGDRVSILKSNSVTADWGVAVADIADEGTGLLEKWRKTSVFGTIWNCQFACRAVFCCIVCAHCVERML